MATATSTDSESSPMTSLWIVVPSHGNADHLPTLKASLQAFHQSFATAHNMLWKCTVYVTVTATYVQNVTQVLQDVCTVEYHTGHDGSWVHTVQVAARDDDTVTHVALLTDTVKMDSSSFDLVAFLETMTRARLNVASPATTSTATAAFIPPASLMPRARCVAHTTQYLDFMTSPLTVFTSPMFRCLQRHLDPTINGYGWGYDVTLADACPDASIGVVHTQIVGSHGKPHHVTECHLPDAIAASTDCRAFSDCAKRAHSQMATWIQRSVSNVSSLSQALEHYQYVAYHRPQTLPFCRLVQFRLDNVKGITIQHRGGWSSVMAGLNASGYVNLSPSASAATTLPLLGFIEYTFKWNRHKQVLYEPWAGFAHMTMQQDTPEHLSGEVLDEILESQTFQDSAKKCVGLFVFTTTMAARVTAKLDTLGLPSIPVCAVLHPIGVEANVTKFDDTIDLEAALSNSSAVVLLGKQYRRIASLHKLRTHRHKVWLPSSNTPSLSKMVATELAAENVPLDPRVEIRRLDSHAEYDTFVRQNIILVDLWSAGANNAVLEGMALQAPFLVRKLDGPIEYLGADYPLFFDTLDQVQFWLDHEDILREKMLSAHKYLQRLDTSRLTVEHLGQQMVQCTAQAMAAWPQPYQHVIPVTNDHALVRDGRQVCAA
jgi:hypothetical protein